jgi:hypothetical protein
MEYNDETRTNSLEEEEKQPEQQLTNPSDIQVTLNSYRNFGRKMFSRKDSSAISVLKTLTPGQITEGCLVCCISPACCPLFTLCPCCGDPDYIKQRRQASSYIHIRENSLEWNEPQTIIQPGICCGIDPCLYDIQDRIQVVYFDDLVFDRISDQTRFCNECRTCCFGGRGERIRMDAPICCGCCQRGSFPFICIPICLPRSLCPCILRYEIYVDDAQKGIYEIKRVREQAFKNELYNSKKKVFL